MPAEPRLDANSDTWAVVRAAAEEHRDRAMTQVVKRGTDPIATEFARGQIALANAILALADAPPKAPEITRQPLPY